MKMRSAAGAMAILAASVAWGQAQPAEQKETVAILLPPESPLAEAIPAALGLQNRYSLADSRRLTEVMKDHPLFLTERTPAQDLADFGKLVAADYLLAVQPGVDGSTIRLIQTATGRVITEKRGPLSKDPFLAAAAVREVIVPTVNPANPDRVPDEDPKKEMAYWQAFANSLMPRTMVAESRSLFIVHTERERRETELAAKAWEHVLMLDPTDNEALLNLGVCFVGLTYVRLNNNQPVSDADKEMAIKGAELAAAAFEARPNSFNGATYSQLINPFEGRLPEQAIKMYEFILAYAKDFPDWAVKPARLHVLKTQPERLEGEIEAAVALADRDPEGVVDLFHGILWGAFQEDPGRRTRVASRYTKDPNPVVRFFAEYVIAANLEATDPDGSLEHYDRMIEVLEAAHAKLPKNSPARGMADYVYLRRYQVCIRHERTEEARKSILAGAAHYKQAGRFDHPIAQIYFLAVTQMLGNEDVEKALSYCHAYLTAKAASQNGGDEDWARQVAEYQAVHKARAPGEKVPDFTVLKLIAGMENASHSRFAVANGQLWIVRRGNLTGEAMVLDATGTVATELPGLPSQLAVAAVGARIYFGGPEGIFEVNAEGKIVRRYTAEAGQLPAESIMDICAAGDALAFTFRDGDRCGVGKLDPATGKITVLAPTNPQATMHTEPVYEANRVWYDAPADRLIVNNDGSGGRSRSIWTQNENGWSRMQGASLWQNGNAPLAVVSQGKEVLTVSVDGKAFAARMPGIKDIPLEQPYIFKIIEPAWDAHTIYLPTYLGLYSVSRTTGEKKWLAHQTDTPIFSAVIKDKSVFLATSRGLYRYDTPEPK